MEYAKINGVQRDIKNTERGTVGKCLCCGEDVVAKVGNQRQYFAHVKGGNSKKCSLYVQNYEQNLSDRRNDIDYELNESEIDDIYNNAYNDDIEDLDGLSQEQLDILNSTEKLIKVDSKIGVGKTFIIEKLFEKYSDKNILYMVFTKAMRIEAQERFNKTLGELPNLKVKTIHSNAFGMFGSKYKEKLVPDVNIFEYAKMLNMFIKDSKEFMFVDRVKRLYEHYLTTGHYTIEDFIKNEIDKYEFKIEDKYNYAINKVFKAMGTGKFNVSHNYYLKLWHLSKPDLSEYDIIAVDECLPEDQFVKTNEGNKSIKTLYNRWNNNEDLPEILSFNENTQTFEYKQMLSAMKSEDRSLLKIKSEGLNVLECTPNHKVLTHRGWKMAKDLNVGKDCLMLSNPENQKCKYGLNDDQLQLVLGSFLGDGHLDKRSDFDTYRVNFTQGEAQKNYIRLKSNIMNIDKIKDIVSGYTGKKNIKQSNFSKTFVLENDVWCELEKLDARGLAIWYMDDGSFSEYTAVIHSNGFNKHENEYLSKLLLRKFNINSEVKLGSKGYYYLYFKGDNLKRLLKIVNPYIVDELRYKTNLDKPKNEYVWNNKFKEYGLNYIKSIEVSDNKTVYDIEVEDNHNFVTLRKSRNVKMSGVIVHNCQDNSGALIDIIDKNTENDSRIIVIGDVDQAIYQFNHSVNGLEILNDGWTQYNLTKSFRVGNTLAKVIEVTFSKLLGKDFKLEGCNKSQKIVRRIDVNKKHWVISRYNATIFRECIKYTQAGKRVYIHSSRANFDFKYLQNLYRFKFFDEKHFTFKKYESYDEMLSEAKKTDNRSLISMDKLMDEHGRSFIYKINDMKELTVKKPELADICYTTAHSSKGMTISDPVRLTTDFPDLFEVDPDQIIPEANLLYVAISRCKSDMELPDSVLSMYLSDFESPLKKNVDDEFDNVIGNEVNNIKWGVN